jgi:hypothetical protein
MGNISRDGAPKKTQTKFETATPPHVVKLGDNVSVPIPGLSRTGSSKLFEGDKLGTVNDGGENPATLKSGHLGIAPKVHPGMGSARSESACHNRVSSRGCETEVQLRPRRFRPIPILQLHSCASR